MKVGMMSFAHMHAYSYANSLQKIDGVTIAGVFDDDMRRGKQAASKYGTTHYSDVDAFLASDLDAVIVCSENIHHKEMVIKAAKAKKHILCEKPLATTKEDAEEMIKICEENGVILQTAFPVRFSRPIQKVKQMIEQSEIGDIMAFRTTNRGQNPGGWFIDDRKAGGGAVLDHTVHMVDIMRWYLGEEVSEVYANVDSFFHNIPIDDAGILTLEFENGVIASHDASWSKSKKNPTWGDVFIEVIGTKQIVKVDTIKEHVEVFTNDEKPLKYMSFSTNMDEGLIRDFVDCVKRRGEPSISGFDGLKAMEVALAAYKSHRTKRPVYLK